MFLGNDPTVLGVYERKSLGKDLRPLRTFLGFCIWNNYEKCELYSEVDVV